MPKAMPSAAFWRLIDAANSGPGKSRQKFIRRATQSLRKLSDQELIAFKLRQEAEMDRAYTWDVWAAAYVIEGGCSDDGFEYFRAWLMSLGSAVWEAALANPDSLASRRGIRSGCCELEEFLYLAPEVYEERTGKDLDEKIDDCPARPSEPAGTPFEDDDLKDRCPALWKKYAAKRSRPP